MNLNRRHISALFTALFIAAISSIGVGGCTAASYVSAMNKSTDQFLPSSIDPRIRYEPGAEAQTQIVAQALPAAIQTVEQAQYRRFVAPVNVYVCASLESFKAYTASAGAGGIVLNKRLFISPKPANTPERLPGLLTHELSHLQIEQQVGLLKSTRIPSWFTGGLAVDVSDGAGAEGVSEDQAREAIRQGKYFQPETEGGLFPKGAHDYGLEPHVFYREASLFVAYLRRLDESEFRTFLLAVEDGKPFASAFQSAYNTNIDEAWQRFIIEIKKPHSDLNTSTPRRRTG